MLSPLVMMTAAPGLAAGQSGTAAPSTPPSAARPLASAAPASASATRKAAAGTRSAAGGLRTVFIPSPNNPLVAIRLFFQIGSVDDPAGKEGLAALTSDVMGQGGTKQRTYAEVLDALYPLAAHIRVIGDVESIVFEGTVHRDNLQAFADLLAEQILQPRFSDDDFSRNRQNAIDYLTKTLRGNDDEELGKQALASLMYGPHHPYGHPAPGTATGLASITSDDVRRFYADHFSRDRLIVGVGGGYPDGFAQAFAARFQALPAKGRPLPKLSRPPAPPRKGAEVLIVEKDARADAISIGYPIEITRSHPDFYPLTVARSYLGEHRTFNGVLMNRLRADRGLNYGDYAYVENFIQDGWSTFPHPNMLRRQQHFEIWLRPVPPQNALFALRGAVYFTRQLIAKGIPTEGFESTRRFLLNYADLWTQDVSRRLGYAIDARVAGKDLVTELKTRLPKMKKSDVDRVIRKYLQMDNFAIAIVTDKAADLRARLLDGKPTPITYDTAGTPPAIQEEDKLIEKEPLPVSAEAVRVVPVEQMFER
ncbi:MAG: pitrilysin family protein [Polyangia bacterium]